MPPLHDITQFQRDLQRSLYLLRVVNESEPKRVVSQQDNDLSITFNLLFLNPSNLSDFVAGVKDYTDFKYEYNFTTLSCIITISTNTRTTSASLNSLIAEMQALIQRRAENPRGLYSRTYAITIHHPPRQIVSPSSSQETPADNLEHNRQTF